jgi:excisionase family DNA binding protein
MSVLTAKDKESAREALQRMGQHPRITAEDGTVLDLPAAVIEDLAEILGAVADGERAVVLRSLNDLTTEQAALVLGVSRPTVVRMIDGGKIPARKVGTHRRLALTDLIAYRDASATRRRDALNEMTRQAEDLGLYNV